MLENTTDLIVEHDTNENAKQKSEDQWDDCDNELRRLSEQEAILVVAAVALPAYQYESVRAADKYVD